LYKEFLETKRLLEALGFLINKKKSYLNSGSKCKFLGYWSHSQIPFVSMQVETALQSESVRFDDRKVIRETFLKK
jgi:hypothetical protein